MCMLKLKRSREPQITKMKLFSIIKQEKLYFNQETSEENNGRCGATTESLKGLTCEMERGKALVLRG